MFVKTASIRVPGALNIDDFDAVRELLAPAEWADEAVIDFSEVGAINATVLGCLIVVINRMVERNRLGIVRIVGANASILRIFELCHAETLFDFASPQTPLAPSPWGERIYAN
jgi:anti-anti-sigma regulatory factor